MNKACWLGVTILMASVMTACEKPNANKNMTLSKVAVEPIVIGELMPRTVFPKHMEDFERGWQLAVEQINAAGGVLGRPLKVESRDDQCDPGVAVRLSEELVQRDNAFMLIGAGCNGPAVSNLAKNMQVPYFSIWSQTNEQAWQQAHNYHFGFGPTLEALTSLYAKKAYESGALRWATIAPNREYGHENVRMFKEKLLALNPNVEFVSDQWGGLNKTEAAEVIQAVKASEPDGLFLFLYDTDLIKFVRQAKARGFLENKVVISDWTGLTTMLNIVGEETPVGWHTCGYPQNLDAKHPMHKFKAEYQARFNLIPDRNAVDGYMLIQFIKAGLEKAGKVDREAFVNALPGLTADTPYGPLNIRDDRILNIACFFGETAVQNGKGVFINYEWVDASKHLPLTE